MLLHQFSNPDNVIVVTSTNPQILIASSYLPPYDTLEQDLTPTGFFLTFVKPINFIWGLDANSKHSIWYSPTIDTRGRILVHLLSLHALITANEKGIPTYSGPTGESWIDVTVIIINSALSVQNWEVSEECTQSDHRHMIFDLRIQRNNKYLKITAGDFTRKFATQVGYCNLIQLKVKKCSQQWKDWVNSDKTKEKLDKSITEIWSKLGEIGEECLPPIPT